MATRYASLARCSDVNDRDVIAALVARDECAALLERIAAMPSAQASARALVDLLMRLATPACTWLEGELAVELFEEHADGAPRTKVRVMAELGGGYRERVLPVIVLRQSPEDVAELVERRQLDGPFRVERISTRCILLLAFEADGDDAGSTAFDISETSLGSASGYAPSHVARAVAGVDDDVDSGWDDAASA